MCCNDMRPRADDGKREHLFFRIIKTVSSCVELAIESALSFLGFPLDGASLSTCSTRPGFAQFSANRDRFRPNPGGVDQIWHAFGQIWPGFGQRWLGFGQIWANPTEIGPNMVDHCRPNLVRRRPNSDRNRAMLAWVRSNLTWVRSKLDDFDRILPEFSRFGFGFDRSWLSSSAIVCWRLRPKFADFGQTIGRSRLWRFGPSLAQIGRCRPKLAQILDLMSTR